MMQERVRVSDEHVRKIYLEFHIAAGSVRMGTHPIEEISFL